MAKSKTRLKRLHKQKVKAKKQKAERDFIDFTINFDVNKI